MKTCETFFQASESFFYFFYDSQFLSSQILDATADLLGQAESQNKVKKGQKLCQNVPKKFGVNISSFVLEILIFLNSLKIKKTTAVFLSFSKVPTLRRPHGPNRG